MRRNPHSVILLDEIDPLLAVTCRYLPLQVRRNPHSVILLDEIEKAHPDVFNLLLQVGCHGPASV